MAFTLGDHVHAVIHAIDEIDIGMARRTEHHLRPFRESPGRMGGEVVRPEVRLHLDNPADAFAVDEMFAEQFLRDRDGVPVVE